MFVQYNARNLVFVGLCVLFCLLVCLYNAWNSIHRRLNSKRCGRLAEYFAGILKEYAGRTPPPQSPDPAVYQQINRHMRHIYQMVALDQAFNTLGWSETSLPPRTVGELLQPIYSHLCRRYRRADDSVQGFVLQLIDRTGVSSQEISEFSLTALSNRSLYLRIQAMHSLGRRGDAQLMIKALTTIAEPENRFSSKLITDTLMDYPGDRRELDEALANEIHNMPSDLQCAIIADAQNRRDDEMKQLILQMLSEENADKEVRISCLKYFGEVHDPAAYAEIVRALKENEWEYVAVAAKCTAAYVSDELIALLKQRLRHQNWYVRYNSAMTLVKIMGDDEAAFQDVLMGNDRYASDIIRYALETSKKEQG